VSQYFSDTHIIAYAVDSGAPEKKNRARELIAPEKPWISSWQVIDDLTIINPFTT
jgi:predicted nucleic acid-binding protein